MQPFKYANFAAAALVGVGSLSELGFSVASIARSVFGVLFAVAIGYLEFNVPPQAARYASFLVSFEGRGAFYIYLGLLFLHGQLFRIIIGLLLAALGGVYVALGVTHRVEAPDSMRLEPELPIDTI